MKSSSMNLDFGCFELGALPFFEDDWCLMDAGQATQTVLSQSRKKQTHELQLMDTKWKPAPSGGDLWGN
jgi:hypothetical protein